MKHLSEGTQSLGRGFNPLSSERPWDKRVGFLWHNLCTFPDTSVSPVPRTVATGRRVYSVTLQSSSKLCACEVERGKKEEAKWRIGLRRLRGEPSKRSSWPGSCTVYSWEVELSWAEEMALPDETHGVTCCCVCVSVCLSVTANVAVNYILVSNVASSLNPVSAHTLTPLLTSITYYKTEWK
jgi:hypothetical protein